jgi:hypothetical protein
VNGHRPAIAGKVQRHLPANALRCTGYQDRSGHRFIHVSLTT